MVWGVSYGPDCNSSTKDLEDENESFSGPIGLTYRDLGNSRREAKNHPG